MQESLANWVHPILRRGLKLQQRLARGATLDLDREQAVLKDMLLSETTAPNCPELDGEPRGGPFAALGNKPAGPRGGFLGVRYALVCWLDELFTCDSPWGPQWNERKLEVELYGSNDRAWKFWEQARLAQARPTGDALEVFYLCVMLGFRGEMRDKPAQLQPWIATTKLRLGNVQEPQWPFATELEPPTRVPPLHGRARLGRMALVSWITALAMVPVLAFVLVQRLGE